MTTVFCTKDFMIADRRSTLRGGEKKHGHISDKTVKIVQPIDRYHHRKRIVAIGGAGISSQIEYVRSLVTNKFFDTNGEARDFRKDIEMLPRLLSCSLMLLMEDGSRTICHFEDHLDRPYTRERDRVTFMAVPADTRIEAIGSGSQKWTMIQKKLRVPDIPAHELFMYCAHLDDGSSRGFSAYSRIEDQLAPSIHYPEDEYAQIIERVHGQIDFLGLDRKPKEGTVWSKEYEKMD